MIHTPLLIVSLFAQTPEKFDWPALIHKPHESRNATASALPPLLIDGESSATLKEWEAARPKLLARWTAILGTPPEKPKSLNVEEREDDRPPGFHRRVLSFAAEGDDRINAALLIPEDIKPNERRPAVVVFHETTPLTYRQPAGLAGPTDRHFGVELVQLGYIVLCPECFILKPPPEVEAGGPINIAKSQAAALKKRRRGWTGMGKLTFDASRCVDFLESLDYVDKDRIGCLGFSLGAKQVIYAMAFEPRYRAGVANEGGIGIRMSNWHDEWYLGAAIKDRLTTHDHHQLLALAAPRALLIQGGGSADGDASWPFIAAALPIYRLHGVPDRLGLHDHGGNHAFPPNGRRVAHQWLDQWLEHRLR